MKNEKIVNSISPSRNVGSNRLCRFLCLALCVVFAFALVGCGNAYTDEDDYQNFVRWQTRYETEKSLVDLLREYDSAYRLYSKGQQYIADYNANFGRPIEYGELRFVHDAESKTILTGDMLVYTEIVYADNSYAIKIRFNDEGTRILADFTTAHIGETISIVLVQDGYANTICSPTVNSPITNGETTINGNFSEDTAEDLQFNMSFGYAKSALQQAAAAYNERREAYSIQRDYMPNLLASEPPFADISSYMKKIEQLGFNL